ncbi:MAG: mevalonate kinase [Candidatus Thalassarchaeaceae archaeon]|nr:mevalonate kinase [Candidatus Thalassarchaeaceae archaeon]
MAVAFAPGKCILFGEHAVVYGHPAVAVAIDQGVQVSLEQSDEWLIEGSPFIPNQHPHISHILYDLFKYEGHPLNIKIKSELFSAAGLGSSAALSVAFGAALQIYLGNDEELDIIKLAKMGHSAEAISQEGRASPTDTAASALGGCIVVSGKEVDDTTNIFHSILKTPEGERKWSINKVNIQNKSNDVYLILGFTGDASPTGKMVSGVSNLLTYNPNKFQEMEAIASITTTGLTALSIGNFEAVGIAMDACHAKLQNLEVSTPSLDRLVDAVRPYSLGAKMTGAGGGGCIVALSRNPQRVAEEIEIAGGSPLISKLGSKGVCILK